MRQGAWKVALSAKVAADTILIIDNLDALDGKTKTWAKAMTMLPLDKSSTLVVSNTLNTKADCSIRNLEKQKYVTLESLTLFDVSRFGKVILTQDALAGLTARLTKTASAVKA
jgi:large subunit ribosomal protein L4